MQLALRVMVVRSEPENRYAARDATPNALRDYFPRKLGQGAHRSRGTWMPQLKRKPVGAGWKLMKNWDLARLATLAEIGASIGVMISVVYLAIQIQGSNEQLRAQFYNDTLDKLHKPLELIAQDQSLAEIVVRAEEDPEALSRAEWQRYSDLQQIRYDAYEHAYYAHKDGELREELWKGIDSILTGRVKSGGFRKFWAQAGGGFAEPFHGYVEAKLRE